MMGMNNRQYMDKENAKKVYQAFNRVYTTGEAYIAFDWEIVRKDGAKRFVETLVSLIRNSKGEGIGFRGIGRDITERKRTEEVLRETQELLTSILDNAPMLIYVTLPDNRYRLVNRGWEEFVRLTREEAVGRLIEQVFSPKTACQFTEANQQVIDMGIPVVTEEFVDRSDGPYYFHTVKFPLRDTTGKVTSVGGISFDITERKRAEEALRVALTKYKTLFDSFPLGITVSDKSGKILETNPMAERLLGVPQEEHVQRKIEGQEWRIVRPDGTPMPADEYASTRALRENRLIENVEMGIVKDKDEITWISVTAAPIPLEGYGVAIAYGDITERKEAEEEKRRLEERSRKVVEDIFRFIPEGVLVFSRKMELLRQNQAFRELVSGYAKRLGFAEDELENLIIDKIKAGMGDKKIKEIRISRKHETWK